MDLKFDFDEQLEQLGKIPRSARLGVVGVILAAIGAGYYFFAHQESHNELGRLRASAQELQIKLTKVRAVANNLDDFEEEVASLERKLELALKQLPNRKQFEDLLQDITTSGKKVGVKIKSIQRVQEVPHDFYAEVPFDLEIDGSYHDIARFFERVSRLPRIVNVGSLKIELVRETRDDARLKVDGTATTFRFLSEDPGAA